MPPGVNEVERAAGRIGIVITGHLFEGRIRVTDGTGGIHQADRLGARFDNEPAELLDCLSVTVCRRVLPPFYAADDGDGTDQSASSAEDWRDPADEADRSAVRKHG